MCFPGSCATDQCTGFPAKVSRALMERWSVCMRTRMHTYVCAYVDTGDAVEQEPQGCRVAQRARLGMLRRTGTVCTSREQSENETPCTSCALSPKTFTITQHYLFNLDKGIEY